MVAISMWPRNPASKYSDLSPAQRLQRQDTVIDKLRSGRASDAATMHDLGGVRLIFPDLERLNGFRSYLDTRTRARHELAHDPNKYDYISEPKQTGYRGIHYVYKYMPSSAKNADYQGLRVEVQLRTAAQHAWATAVEIADLVSDTRTKFEDGTGQYGLFIRLCSELIARRHEKRNSCLPDHSYTELLDEFNALEAEFRLLARLGQLREQGDLSKIKQHTVLAFQDDDTVEIFGYTKAHSAIAKEKLLSADPSCVNVVYVSSAKPAAIRSSYRNYLTNPEDFVGLMSACLEEPYHE